MSRDSIKEIYEERCAIMQFDSGLSRQAAETAALGELVRRYGASVRPIILGSSVPQTLIARGIQTGTTFAKFRDSVAQSSK